MNNENKFSEVMTKKITLSFLLAWIYGIFIGLASIIQLFSTPITGIFSLMSAIIILPPTYNWLKNKLHFSLSKTLRIIIALILIAIAGSFSGNISSNSLNTPVTDNSNTTTQTTQKPADDRKVISIVFAEDVIKKTLKAPSTAKFVDVKAYENSNIKDVWIINGYVDSQNSYGAMLRSIWEVQLDYRDGKGGTVKSIMFDGEKIL